MENTVIIGTLENNNNENVNQEKDCINNTISYFDNMSNYLNTGMSHIYSTYQVTKDKLSYYMFSESVKTPERIADTVSYYNQYTTCYSAPTLIRDNIYLGSAYNAANHTTLKELEIDIIINITKEINNYYPEEFKYYKYEIDDSESSNIENYLEESYKILKEEKNKKKLVHCYMGASRSASLIIYYLMREYKMKFDEAYEFIKSKRIVVNPNKKFAEILKMKEKELELCGS